MNANIHIFVLFFVWLSLYECVLVYICISFVFVSCVSKIVSFCANNNELAVLRPLFLIATKLTLISRRNFFLFFGLTRTLRAVAPNKRRHTRNSTEANERAQKGIEDNRERARESVCERRRSGKRGIKGEWTTSVAGKNKRFGLNFFTFEIFIFLLLCFFLGFSSLFFFPHNTFVFLLSLCPQKEKILLLKTVDSSFSLLPLVCLTVFLSSSFLCCCYKWYNN